MYQLGIEEKIAIPKGETVSDEKVLSEDGKGLLARVFIKYVLGTVGPEEPRAKDMRESSYRFFRDLVLTFDAISIASLILYAIAAYQILGLDIAIAFTLLYVIRGVGHFSSLRHSKMPCQKMRFIPFLGGYMTTGAPFLSRSAEGFSSIGPSIWTLASAIMAYNFYLISGEIGFILFLVLSLTITLFVLFPFVPSLEGCTIVKSIAFSISGYLGFLFILVNMIAFPSCLYWILSKQGPVDVLWLSPLILGSAQMFSEEINNKTDIKLMSRSEIVKLSSLYISVILSSLFLLKLFGIWAISESMNADIFEIARLGVLVAALTYVFKGNVIFWLRLKRRIFGMI